MHAVYMEQCEMKNRMVLKVILNGLFRNKSCHIRAEPKDPTGKGGSPWFHDIPSHSLRFVDPSISETR